MVEPDCLKNGVRKRRMLFNPLAAGWFIQLLTSLLKRVLKMVHYEKTKAVYFYYSYN
jgi:hypothetical protein